MLLGILCHIVLRLGGSPRRLQSSLAIVLFAGGGPGLVLTLGMYAVFWVRITVVGGFHPGEPLLFGTPPWLAAILLFAPSAWFLVTLVSGLRGLHAVSALRVAGALLIALAASGLVLGMLHAVIQFTLGVPHFVVVRGAVPFDIFFE